MMTMTKEELAAKLNGREIGNEMTKAETKQAKSDELFGLQSRIIDDDLVYLSPTGIELLRVSLYFDELNFDELKNTWRVSATHHNDQNFQSQLFYLHTETK